MKILSFDLELNQAATGPKIIEVGACIGDTLTGNVIDRFSCFVNPQQPLVPKIIKLTGITEEQVATGVDITTAYQHLEVFAQQHRCLRMPLVWGAGDSHAFRRELSQGVWQFGHRELDAKAVFQSYRIVHQKAYRAGLASAMTTLGLTFQGRPHRALDDAENTFLIFKALLKRWQC